MLCGAEKDSFRLKTIKVFEMQQKQWIQSFYRVEFSAWRLSILSEIRQPNGE